MREFNFNDRNQYFKNYFRYITIPLMFVIWGGIRLFLSDMKFKNTFKMILLIIYPVLFIIIGILGYIYNKKKKYIIGKHSIKIGNDNKYKEYLYSKIIRIKCAPIKYLKKYGMDYFTIYFNNDTKISLSNQLPFYYDFKKCFKEILINEGYYKNIAIYGEL